MRFTRRLTFSSADDWFDHSISYGLSFLRQTSAFLSKTEAVFVGGLSVDSAPSLTSCCLGGWGLTGSLRIGQRHPSSFSFFSQSGRSCPGDSALPRKLCWHSGQGCIKWIGQLGGELVFLGCWVFQPPTQDVLCYQWPARCGLQHAVCVPEFTPAYAAVYKWWCYYK